MVIFGENGCDMKTNVKRTLSVALLLTCMLFCLSCEEKSSIITKDVAFKSGEVSVFVPAQAALAGIDLKEAHIVKNESGQYVMRLVDDFKDSESFVDMESDALYLDPVWPAMNIFSTHNWGGVQTSAIGRSSFTYSFLNDGALFSQLLKLGISVSYAPAFDKITEICLDKPFVLSFGSSIPAYLSEGFEINFPDEVFVRKDPASKLDFTVIDGHRIVVGSELPLPQGSRTLQFGLIMEKIVLSEDHIHKSNRWTEVDYELNIELIGDHGFYKKDFEKIPTSYDFRYDMWMTSSAKDHSILASLEQMIYTWSASKQAVLPKVPEILKEKGLSLDRNSLYMYLDLENCMPTPVEFSTDLKTSEKATVTLIEKNDPLRIPALGEERYFLYSGKGNLPNDRIAVFIPSYQSSGLLDVIPEKVSLQDTWVQFSTNRVEYQMNKGAFGGIRTSYSLDVPLQYTDGEPITLIHDVRAGLGLQVHDGVQSLVVKMDIENNAGFAPTLSVVATDKAGEAYVDTEVKVEQAIKIGQTASLTLLMPVAAGGMTVDGFKLAYTIPVPGPELDSYLYDFSTINVKNLRVALQGPSDLL